MDYIEEAKGKMLSETWEEQRHRDDLRSNLFRALSRTILSLARVPLPRIGSFTVGDDGLVTLTTRPLTLELQHLENECIPVDMPRDLTYATTDAYVLDLLACHDSRLRHQPNAVNDQPDCLSQMSALTVMETVIYHFFHHSLRQGPFVFTLTDLHQSNIFVDDDWNITCLVDLEWACSRPIEMQHPPFWLTANAVDRIDEPLYNELR